jgi:hypothetical protein
VQPVEALAQTSSWTCPADELPTRTGADR